MPAAATSRRRATSRTRSGCCSGATRRSTRRATRARSCGSCTTSGKRGAGALRGLRGERDWPIANLTWDYPERPDRDPDAEDGPARDQRLRRRRPARAVAGFAELKADGTTACGCWIYSGCFADGVNQTRRRDPGDLDAPGGWVSPDWGWAWPANRRILYNRASADPEGRPWSERKRYIWWDETEGDWTGYDVPDFPADKRPDYRARRRTPRAWTRSPATTRSS